MRFYKTADPKIPAQKLAKSISEHLEKGEKVLWLAGGGSGIVVAVETCRLLNDSGNLKGLTFTLTDERFGEVGHADSNWQQLIDAGFSLAGANLMPVLTGKDIETTAKDFASVLSEQIKKADYAIGLFGMGADGHTAGILPNSPAVNAEGYASFYSTPQFGRVTMTFDAIKNLDEAVLYAVGEAKHKMLDKLEQDLELSEQPAQILKKINRLSIYNDYKGEEV
jgi:6-phosphogluconolactonase/glucosamine-6-phosphate isomerase/deaminase